MLPPLDHQTLPQPEAEKPKAKRTRAKKVEPEDNGTEDSTRVGQEAE
jgi:hypothetical protein